MDQEKNRRFQERESFYSGLLLPMLLFGSMGAIGWAIRGTSGWGGMDGVIVPGMTWGLIWYYLCHRRGIDARTIPLWLGLGISIGGEWGYGQYVSWIRGQFEAGDGLLPMAPWVGYAWFAICGIAWGATGAIPLGWALGKRRPLRHWLARLLVPIGVGALGWLLVRCCPYLFFPNYRLGLYAGELDHHLLRTVETNTQNFIVAAWWIGAMLTAAFQRDRATLVIGALIGGGFGIGFPLSAIWCLGYTYAPEYIDWWKMWELTAGFILGLQYAIAWYWAVRHTVAVPDAPPSPRTERRRNIALIATAFLLLFILFFGATSTVGVLLGLYPEKDVDQYAWPPARMALFAPFALLLFGTTARAVANAINATHDFAIPHLAERMADLMALIAAVGVATIWPSKIGVLYAWLLCAALFAIHRLNRYYDDWNA